jgi:hypothetical protein
MPQEEKRRTLVARWKPERDCSVDLPDTVYWSDGSPATMEDYLTHLLDTHTFSSGTDGIKLHICFSGRLPMSTTIGPLGCG